ncbi:MAG: 23S rRNA (pseudouridine(1915)-N(3))-methyltransferase RlmH [Oscillospiraceae bacterium]|nr:23S rRNA (pseudouridine(1915)-N(3))-methyltransferase RlmH [Oscillospiraceae bacterium]
MMNVTIVAVGGLKEKYLKDACCEYIKRLGAFCRLLVVEVNEYKLKGKPSAAEIERSLSAESADILKKIPQKSFLIPLCIEGEQLSSPCLAEKIRQISGENHHITFIIGGSHGLCGDLKNHADFKLSMSSMTFPHQLARVMLLEQLYRAFSILNGMRYHK